MNRKLYPLLLITASMLFIYHAAVAQNLGFEQDDYIKVSGQTSDAQINALPATQKQTTIQYYDGLGRPVQTIAEKASPLGNDMIQPVVYDNLGRQTAGYLPYTDGSGSYANGAYRPNAISSDQPGFYNQTGQYLIPKDAAPYSQQLFENSPLQRLLTAGMVGTGYQPSGAPLSGGSGTQHYKSAIYRSNISSDGNILIWNPDGSFTAGNYYAANSLSVTDAKDEDGIETLVFSDYAGRTILKRQLTGSSNADTYYIYNNASLPAYIIPPGALALMVTNGNYSITQSGVSSMIFQFTYDAKGRMMQKIVPGKGAVSIIYDPLNRPVLMQDANMLALNEWNYIRYDVKGRAISQGIYTDTNTGRQGQSEMQSYVNSLAANYQTAWYETRNTVLGTGYYTAVIFPVAGTGITLTPLAFAYFDNYTLTSGKTFTYTTQGLGTYEETATTAPVKGMPTMVRTVPVGSGLAASIIRINVTFYDKRMHPIQVQSNNQLYNAGNNVVTDYSTTAPDFIGVPQVAQVSKTIASGTGSTTTVQTSFTYDQMDRVLTVSQAYNLGASQLVASYSYNELGQVIKKGLGYVNSTTWLQNVDYRFNIRGQLTSINNGTLAYDNGVTNSDYNDVFGMTFIYDQADGVLSNTPYYNGDLSEVKWMSLDGSGSNERAFTYNYDQLNRYTSSAYAESSNSGSSFTANIGAYNESITYNTDNSGNIHYLTRGTSTAYLDNLTYSYDPANPNQLHTVTDAGDNTAGQGFYKLTSSTTPYFYDANGNLTHDYYKGITTTINYLNRPNRVTVSTGNYINYTYDASGTVLRKQQYSASTLQTTTDYIDGFVFITTTTGTPTLSYFPMPEGRVMNNGGTLTQEFIITDQQGNARISFNNTGTGGTAKVVQENSYYGTGLTIQPIVTGDDNKKLYNGGSEWQNDFSNLPDYYQTFYRNYDPSIARFNGVDPEAESAESMTSYQYAGNNPVMNNDPMGNLLQRAPVSSSSAGTGNLGNAGAISQLQGNPDGYDSDNYWTANGGNYGGSGASNVGAWEATEASEDYEEYRSDLAGDNGTNAQNAAQAAMNAGRSGVNAVDNATIAGINADVQPYADQLLGGIKMSSSGKISFDIIHIDADGSGAFTVQGITTNYSIFGGSGNQGGQLPYPRGAIGGPVPWYGNFLGPGPNKDSYGLIGYNGKILKPIDMLDAAAQRHDHAYYLANTGGINGALFNTSVKDADLQLANQAEWVLVYDLLGINDTVSGKPVTSLEASWAFSVLVAFRDLGTLKGF